MAAPAVPVAAPPAGAEQGASAWQGGARRAYPEDEVDGASADLLLNAALARLTGFISPVALGLAWQDWASHLLLSPVKQSELAVQAVEGAWRWLHYAQAAAGGPLAGPVQPLAQDRRFDGDAWQQWPYNVISQGFLLQQQWWHRATHSVRGVSRHHGDVVTFVARQLLDCVAPSNFVATNPEVQQVTLATRGANLASGMARASADAWRAWQGDGARLPLLRPGHDTATTAGTVVLRNRLIELLRYDAIGARVRERPLLIVPAWIMKYYILDLADQASLVRYLVEQGHTVYMISWKNPDAGDRALAMEDYRRLGIMAALDAIGARHGGAAVNACGYCLGGTLLAIAAAAMARDGDDRLASITLLAAQVDFTEPGELSLFIDDSEISFLEAAMWRDGYLDTRQMAGAFQLLRSNDLIWSYRLRHYLLGQPEQANAMMAWNADATRMPYRMHSEYLRYLFLDNQLATGRYLVDGAPVALADIHVPIFAVGTVNDHVAPWRSVYKIVLLTDTDVTFLLSSGGHNAGIVAPPASSGRSFQQRWHRADAPYVDPEHWRTDTPVQAGSWWPSWQHWLDRHSGAWQAATSERAALAAAPGTYVLQR